MKKILTGVVVLGVLVSSTAFASPLTKIEQGKGKIDAAVSISPRMKTGDTDLNGKTRYRFGATYGVSDNLGLDYVYAANAGNHDSSVQSHQINLLYQFNPYVAGFGGFVWNKFKMNGYGDDTTNGYQVGVQGRYGLNDKTAAWAKFGIGNTITQYEIGVGYDLTKNWEANLFYNDSKYKDFSNDASVKTHSINLGVSYKF
jgi:opacity protein-like surface antigen